MASRNDGKELENLVQILERSNLPDGFTIETRRGVFDDSGVQIAELDILITGKVGTSTWTELIECRDRPSGGPAPVSWIEQLVGRRDRLKIDKVMAVSTTRFAKPAQIYAEQKGIELRALADLDPSEITSAIPRSAPLLFREVNLKGGRVFLPSDDAPEDGGVLGQSSVGMTRIRINATGAECTLSELWQKCSDKEQLSQGVPIDGKVHSGVVTLPPEILKQLSIERDGAWVPLVGLEFDVEVKLHNPVMRLVKAGEYVTPAIGPNGEETHAHIFEWRGKDTDPIASLMMIASPKKQCD